MGRSRSALGERIDAADPGALRRLHAARAALAALTAWLALRLIVPWLAGQPMPAVGLYAVTVCFISALAIADAPRAARRLTLWLSMAVFALALLMASLLNAAGWLYPIVLLALIFASYAVRRRGLRPGELLLILTMGLYFAEGSRVAWNSLAWFLLAAVIGVGSLWMWQFVILPYDPALSLRRSVRSFYNRAAAIVDVIAAAFESGPAPADDAAWTNDLQRRLKHARLSRRVIESQFPGVLPPGGWTEREIGQLRLALYAAEQGLAQMVEGAGDRPQLSGIPAEMRPSLARTLRSLHAALIAGSAESMQALAQESAALQVQVRAYASELDANERGDTGAPLAPWVAGALRLVAGSYQVASSIAQVRALAAQEDAPRESGEMTPGATSRKSPGLPPLVRALGRFDLHPTTVLGIQAVAATGLAMLAARLLNMDHSNWVFWTAFVVIAGSTGESLRKMTMRVVGTVGGVVIGVALALLTPDNTALVVLVATACVFLTIYSAPVSYPRMVFWLNIGFVMVYTLLGAKELDLLFARPSTTLLGAVVAALVVVYLFPIRISDRFKVAAARFLAAVDGYVAAYVTAMTGGGGEQPLAVAQAQVAAAYAVVEQTLPGVAFENNPLLQAESPLTQQGTRMAALDAEVTRLANAASERDTQAESSGAVEFMRSLQALIHGNIQAIIPLLDGARAHLAKAASPDQSVVASQSVRSWALAAGRLAGELQAGGAGQAQYQSSGGLALIRIHGIVNQLVAELGASGEAPQRAGAS